MANTQKVKTGFVACGSPPCSWQDSLPILRSWAPSLLEGFTPLHCKAHGALESVWHSWHQLGWLSSWSRAFHSCISAHTVPSESAWHLVTSAAAVPPWILGRSSCHNLLSWLMLLCLVQRPPHASLDPLKILTQQVWLGERDRVIAARVKSDPSFTALTFVGCCLHNNCKIKQDGTRKTPWKCLHLLTTCSSLTYPQELCKY